MIKLADLDTMVIKAEISEADVPRVKPGQPVYFTMLGDPDNPIAATLMSIDPAPIRSRPTDTTTPSHHDRDLLQRPLPGAEPRRQAAHRHDREGEHRARRGRQCRRRCRPRRLPAPRSPYWRSTAGAGKLPTRPPARPRAHAPISVGLNEQDVTAQIYGRPRSRRQGRRQSRNLGRAGRFGKPDAGWSRRSDRPAGIVSMDPHHFEFRGLGRSSSTAKTPIAALKDVT